MVHRNWGFYNSWSKNTTFVTSWITLWITAFYEKKAKVLCITLQHLKEFYCFIAKLMNKSYSSQWEFGQHFLNFRMKIHKNNHGRRIWYLWEFLKINSLLMWSSPESCNQIQKTHLNFIDLTIKHHAYSFDSCLCCANWSYLKDRWKANIENETALGPHVYQKGPPNRGGVGHAGVLWVIQWQSGLCKFSLNNFICHKLGILSFLLTNYCKLLSG